MQKFKKQNSLQQHIETGIYLFNFSLMHLNRKIATIYRNCAMNSTQRIFLNVTMIIEANFYEVFANNCADS